jgi:alpha-mannosidase II
MRLCAVLVGVLALELYVVPHSHCDPGWLETFEYYYSNRVKFILDNFVVLLQEDLDRRFVWSEM